MIIKCKLFANHKHLEYARKLGIKSRKDADNYVEENNDYLTPEQIQAIHEIGGENSEKLESFSGYTPNPADPGHGNRKLEILDPRVPKDPKKGWKLVDKNKINIKVPIPKESRQK